MLEIYEDWLSVESADRYDRLHRIGEGAFGEVRLGRCRRTGKEVALKSVHLPVNTESLPKAVFREMESLRQLSSPNVISLLAVFPEETNIILVLEHAYTDLGSVISSARQYLDRRFIRQTMLMILNGLRHCHGAGVLHRDVKPSNILITKGGIAKLGDFGLARLYNPKDGRSMSHQVATRWYRAPELLFAARHYTPAVDVWSTGAIFAELFSLCPLFPGVNDIDQMFRVFQVMGSPTPAVWPGVEDLPDYEKVSFPVMQPIPLTTLIPNTLPADIEFLQSILKLCPGHRATCAELLSCDYFCDIPAVNQCVSFNTTVFLEQHKANESTDKSRKKNSRKVDYESAMFDVDDVL